MGSDQPPPARRSYSALFRDSRINVGNLYRHLSGLGLASIHSEIEAIRGTGRMFVGRVCRERPDSPYIQNIYSSLHQLERGMELFARMVCSGAFDVGVAKEVCDSINQQYHQLRMYARALDRGRDYLV